MSAGEENRRGDGHRSLLSQLLQQQQQRLWQRKAKRVSHCTRTTRAAAPVHAPTALLCSSAAAGAGSGSTICSFSVSLSIPLILPQPYPQPCTLTHLTHSCSHSHTKKKKKKKTKADKEKSVSLTSPSHLALLCSLAFLQSTASTMRALSVSLSLTPCLHA